MSNIWDPDEHQESGFTPAEDLIEEGASYKVINAVVDAAYNPGQQELRLYLKPTDRSDEGIPDEGILFRLRMADQKSSKFSRFLKSLADLDFHPAGPDDFIGLEFTAHKEVVEGTFRNRENPDGPRVKRAVTYITASALGSTPQAVEAAADNEELIDLVLDFADGQVFSAILTLVANEPKLAPLRPRISNKSLLNELIDAGRLTLDGRTYKRVEN